ncbi:MAG: DUF3768 domain-containing protein [Elusimicrobia bacterium]|nr:DUF3768 domain-containing protein [Elusimicrobiota bacterium]
MSIAERNDAFRKNILFSVDSRNKMLITQGITASFNDKQIADIFGAVRDFNNFNQDNNPWGEHDFGSILIFGRKIFWKIDDYQGEDATDLVLTILLAEEY